MTIADFDLDSVDFSKGGGSVTVVAQDQATGKVLMVAHADREALAASIQTGQMHYRSRTRGLWHKGATSGNVQRVVSLTLDCDGDAVLARVVPAGPACHTGQPSCFAGSNGAADVFSRLDSTIAERAATPAADSPSYTRKLLSDRNLRLKKIGEEASELVVAAADEDRPRTIEEAADLVYHTLVVLRSVGAGVDDLRLALQKRE